jgi:CubicO group peptidase (beta-lactamase class C family)
VHLANTTSALPDNLPDRPEVFRNPNPDSIAPHFYRLHINRTRQDFYADLHQVKLTRAPGTVPQHSNVAAELLGYILERVYKMPYEDLVKKYITGPRQMTSTSTALTIPKAKAPLQAKGHGPTSKVTPYHTLPDLQIAGGLNSTTTDLLKYLQLQLDPSNAAVKLSHQPTFGSPNSEAMALNWFITKTIDSKLAFAHSGGTFGFASYCVFYPELNRGLVLLANRNDGSTESRLAELAAGIEEGTYGLPPALGTLRSELQKRNFAQAFEVMQKVKKKHPELHLSEDYVNSWGYSLLRSGKKPQAVEMFKLNVSLYPKSANTYDSLGEAYEENGNKALAISNFKRSLELNPANLNAVDHLKKLEAGGANTNIN